MGLLIFLAAFAVVALAGWAIFAVTHPVAAGQGILIFLCQAAGVIALITAIGFWIGQGFLHAIPGFLFMAGLFFSASKLKLRWRRG